MNTCCYRIVVGFIRGAGYGYVHHLSNPRRRDHLDVTRGAVWARLASLSHVQWWDVATLDRVTRNQQEARTSSLRHA